MMACGNAHYMMVTNDNMLAVCGKSISVDSELENSGFKLYNGDLIFE